MEKNEDEWTGKVETSSREKPLAEGEACMAILWLTPGFKENLWPLGSQQFPTAGSVFREEGAQEWCIKGNSKQRHKLAPDNVEKVANLSIGRFRCLLYPYPCNRSTFLFALKPSVSGLSHVISFHSLPTKSRKGLAHDAVTHSCHTRQSCSWHCRRRLPDAQWQCSWSCPFKHTLKKLDHKYWLKDCCESLKIFFTPFLLTGFLGFLARCLL